MSAQEVGPRRSALGCFDRNQDRRRKAAIERQREERHKLIARKRVAALVQADELERKQDGAVDAKTKRPRWMITSEMYAKQLQHPEWMIEIPSNLATEWIVVARPEGRRCLIVTGNGKTKVRNKTGRLDGCFETSLPGGGSESGGGEYCVIEGVFNESSNTYFLLDLLIWKGQSYIECTADFRVFWLMSKLFELGTILSSNRSSFALSRWFESNSEGIRQAYTCSEYQRDGLLFYNKQGHYGSGLTPLVLQWKDAKSSPYVYTSGPLNCILQVSHDGQAIIAMGGDEIARPSLCEIAPNKLSPGQLLRFEYASAMPSAEDGSIKVEGLKLLGHAGKTRRDPDSSCKLCFQYMLRASPLTIEQLLDAVSAPLSS